MHVPASRPLASPTLDPTAVHAVADPGRAARDALACGTEERACGTEERACGADAGGLDSDLLRVWGLVRAQLLGDCGDKTFNAWLKPLQLLGTVRGPGAGRRTVRLALPSRFQADWVRNHFAERLRHGFAAHLGDIAAVTIEVMTIEMAPAGPPADGRPGDDSVGNSVGNPVSNLVGNSGDKFGASFADGRGTGAAHVRAGAQGAPSGGGLPAEAAGGAGDAYAAAFEPRYSFDGFVVGKSNELAFNAAQAVAAALDGGGGTGFNPLFLHGGTGLGKTHLMHAIGAAVLARNPGARVVYLSAEKFMVAFLAALRARDTIGFKQWLRSCDLLMVDDVQFIAGKDSTQEEFFHTMNEIISAGKWLVISADRSPQNLEGIERRILSRLAWGLVADINPADYELRYNILAAKLAAMPGAAVPDEVLQFLARKIVANVRELEGALNRVIAYANLVGRPVDLDFARDVLADVLRAHSRKLTIDEIQRRVADHYALKLNDMLSPRRAREVARPRQVAMYLAKALTVRSLPEIGRRFGGRDHTTVMHAVKRIEALRRTDHELDHDIAQLQRSLDA